LATAADHYGDHDALYLDSKTELTDLGLTLVPLAGEAVLYVPLPAPNECERQRRLKRRRERWAEMTDQERQEDQQTRDEANWKRANDRAKVNTRRYVTANRLNLMFVLTRSGGEGLHGPEGRARMMSLTSELVERLRGTAWNGHAAGDAIPAWWGAELHPGDKGGGSSEVCPDPVGCGCGGHGWHVNLFLRGPWVPQAVVKRMWHDVDHQGNGHQVKYRDWTKGNGQEEKPYATRLRDGARYATKYATKDWSPEQIPMGAHRYEVSQGFLPERITVSCGSLEEAQAILRSISGVANLEPAWRSEDLADWEGPDCVGYEWSPSEDPEP
jgi:hypothetical protein